MAFFHLYFNMHTLVVSIILSLSGASDEFRFGTSHNLKKGTIVLVRACQCVLPLNPL
jgi:hypothetical protein